MKVFNVILLIGTVGAMMVGLSTVVWAAAAEEAGWEPTEEVEMVVNAEGKKVEAPQHGGSASFAAAPGSSWCWYEAGYTSILHPFYDTMLQPDWKRSSQGTGELDFGTSRWAFISQWVPGLLESYTIENATSATLHVRAGVHFWQSDDVRDRKDELQSAYGRELLADDIVRTIRELKKRRSNWLGVSQEDFKWEVVDKYTIRWTWPEADAHWDSFCVPSPWALCIHRMRARKRNLSHATGKTNLRQDRSSQPTPFKTSGLPTREIATTGIVIPSSPTTRYLISTRLRVSCLRIRRP